MGSGDNTRYENHYIEHALANIKIRHDHIYRPIYATTYINKI